MLPRALARIVSVNAGPIRPLTLPIALERQEDAPRQYCSAIAKSPLPGRIAVGEGGIVGDAQADRVHHGGPDKAVHAHFLGHLAWWAELRGAPLLPGAIGENLTLAPLQEYPLDEEQLCIGDVLQAGTALLQVSQPRIPCFKQAAALSVPQALRLIAQTGRSGLYLRVLQPGMLQAGDPMLLLQRPHPELTVAAVNRWIHQARQDPALRARIAACPALGQEVRRLAHAADA